MIALIAPSSNFITNTEKYYWLESACHSRSCNGDCKKIRPGRNPRWAKSTDIVGKIQCCSYEGVCTRTDADDKCFGDNGDVKAYNYLEAERICALNNKRLCTKAELLTKNASGCCMNGCALDDAIVWTNDSQYGLFMKTCMHVRMYACMYITVYVYICMYGNMCTIDKLSV